MNNVISQLKVRDNKVFDRFHFLECRDSMNRLQPVWMFSLGKPQQEYFSCISLLPCFHQLFIELLNSLCWGHFLWHWSTSVSPDKFSSHCYQDIVPHSLTPIPTFTLCDTAWGQTLSTACTQASPKITETFTSGSKKILLESPKCSFPPSYHHLRSASPLASHTDLRIDVTILWMKCNIQQKAGTNTFSMLFLFPPKLFSCYASKAKLAALFPSSLSLQWLLWSDRSAALTFFSFLFEVWGKSLQYKSGK